MTVNPTKFTDVVVAVHGIGMQKHSETIRSVATRLARSKKLHAEGKGHPVAPQPLGYFYSDPVNLAAIRLVDDPDVLKEMDLAAIGFTEVYWSDIPQEAIDEKRTLEETKAWARTVVSRARAYARRSGLDPKSIVPPDFGLAGEVLDDVIDTVEVLENLVFLAGKAGLFQFDLADLLREYVGDVQLVTEFGLHRRKVVDRFHLVMESIYQQQPQPVPENFKIHIVAHSEGTVVSFLGLLEALSKKRRSLVPDPAGVADPKMACSEEFPPWLKHVAGYMTIGSPIDKHLLLWPRLWKELAPSKGNADYGGKIHWRNYYDYGDPVGFELDTARDWLASEGVNCQAFEFCGCTKCNDDIGFARYFFPGEAHNEYWNDPAVFEHFIKDVVRPEPSRPKPPGNRFAAFFLSPSLPYVLCGVILIAGVLLFLNAVRSYAHPDDNPLQQFVRFRELGVASSSGLSKRDFLRTVAGVAALIAGATLLGRFHRLARGWIWAVVGIAAHVLGCLLYWWVVPSAIRGHIGARFVYLNPWCAGHGPTLGVVAVATAAGLLAWLAVLQMGDASRRLRMFWKGTRPVMACGAVMVAAVVVLQLLPPNPRRFRAAYYNDTGTSFDTNALRMFLQARLTPLEVKAMISTNDLGPNWGKVLPEVMPLLTTRPPAWPMLLAGAAFLYLWWLALLLFDLSFTWQRYIRHSVANRRLRLWNPYHLSQKAERRGKEPCRKLKIPSN